MADPYRVFRDKVSGLGMGGRQPAHLGRRAPKGYARRAGKGTFREAGSATGASADGPATQVDRDPAVPAQIWQNLDFDQIWDFERLVTRRNLDF